MMVPLAAQAATIDVPTGQPTIQAAINAASPGDTIVLAAGSYTEAPINLNKAVTIQGPNAGTAGSAVRVAEAVITNTAITVTASGAVIDGVEIFQTNDTSNAVLIQAGATLQNSVVRRNGVTTGASVRGVATTNVSGIVISGNLFTGDTSGGLFGGHKTWNSAIYANGGGLSITGNTFENSRTALNMDDMNPGVTITGNTFRTSGSYISFGGVAATTGSYSISGNEFGFNFALPPASNPTLFNNSNVASSFRLDVTGNTFGGVTTGALTDTQKFLLEPRMFHRGRSGRQGVVDYIAGQQIVMAGTTIASAIDAASAGNTVLVGPGTYIEDVSLNKSVTLKGAGSASTTISGPIGGAGSTVTMAASNAVVEGFTITRAGNNLTDWNDGGLNSAGVAIQGQGFTGNIIRNNNITGMRTAIDVNNSNGHSILNNVIDNNRTGLIFRNQTDNLTVTENAITNNWTVGVLFLDASGGTNSPIQTAAGCTFANNNISGNWYGQVVDRQTGGSLPAPGSNPKNFDGNWFGTATPSRSNANSAEPSYASQIPVAFGGTATPPLTPPADILGTASANIVTATALSVGTDTDAETSPGRGVFGFQGDGSSLAPVSYTNQTITGTETYANLSIANGVVRVTSTGILNVTGSLNLGPGATLIVEGGTLNLGNGSTISGSFTIFNSFGSWNINGDTTINVSQSLALVTEIHVAPGVTLTVNGGGELIVDGSTIDSQTPGSPYNIVAAADGLLTIARSVVSDANITINTTVALPQRSQIYDSRLEDTTVTVAAGAVDARVYHNIFDNVTTNEGTVPAPYAGIDGWGNVTSEAALQNRFTLNYQTPLLATRTLDAAGNLYVQPSDAVVVKMDVSNLGTNTITAAEALLGYNSDLLELENTAPAVTAESDWEVIFDDNSINGTLGSVDSAVGLDLIGPGNDGVSGPATIAKIHFEALLAGRTANFFRVQTNGIYIPFSSTLLQDTRLTASTGGVPSYLTAFTANSGDLIIDDQIPVVNSGSLTATQVQPSLGTVNILTPPTTNRVFRNGAPLSLSFTAVDAGLAGLETGSSDAGEVLNAAEVYNDVVIYASNGTTTLNYSTITAVTASGTVTYSASMNVPPTATTGVYTISATVRDRSGNLSADTVLGQFTIANEALATVELESFTATTRNVTFVATDGLGAPLASWTKTITNFSSGIGSVILENVPAGTVAISAKTAWHLRSRVAASFSPEGVGTAVLTGSDKLPGGDLNGDNVINTFDYSVLRFNWTTANAVADITGDGSVFTADYLPLRANFFTIGDSQ